MSYSVAESLLRECRELLNDPSYWRAVKRDYDGEGLYEYCRSCGGRFDYYRPGDGDGLTTKHRPDCKHVDRIARIDAALHPTQGSKP